MVRTDRYKYIVYESGANPQQLFNEDSDPGEMRNLVTEPALKDVLSNHRELLRSWIKATKDTFALPVNP